MAKPGTPDPERPVRRRIANRIRGALRERDVTVVQVAAAAGVSTGMVQWVIRGGRSTDDVVEDALRAALGFDPWAKWLTDSEQAADTGAA